MHGLNCLINLGSHSLKSSCHVDQALIWKLWGRIHFPSNSRCWQNSVPWGYKKKSPFLCWLSAKDWSQLIETFLISWHMRTSIFKPARVHWILILGISLASSSVVCVKSPQTCSSLCAHRAPLSMGFSRQGCWSGLPFPSPGNLPNPGVKPMSPVYSAWGGGWGVSLPLAPPGKPFFSVTSW